MKEKEIEEENDEKKLKGVIFERKEKKKGEVIEKKEMKEIIEKESKIGIRVI